MPEGLEETTYVFQSLMFSVCFILLANHYARKDKQSTMTLNFGNFENALAVVRPSSMREVILEVPKVKWSDIGGQHDLKKRLEEMVVWPLKYAHALDRLHVQVPKGILMYGPPGCSKTMVAKAVATESGLNFIAVKVYLPFFIHSSLFYVLTLKRDQNCSVNGWANQNELYGNYFVVLVLLHRRSYFSMK